MKLFSIRNLAMTGALSVAGLGLVGMGAHAVFTSTAGDTQTITAGTLAISATSTDGGSCAAYDGSGNCGSWTLPSVGGLAGVNSTFNSGVYTVTFTNNGSLGGWYLQQLASFTTSAPSAFADHAYVCVYQTGLGGHYNGPLYDGPISGITTAGAYIVNPYTGENNGNAWEYEILPTQADSFSVQFYAGGAGTGPNCTQVASQLTNVDMGGGATLTLTNTFSDTANA